MKNTATIPTPTINNNNNKMVKLRGRNLISKFRIAGIFLLSLEYVCDENTLVISMQSFLKLIKNLFYLFFQTLILSYFTAHIYADLQIVLTTLSPS